MVAHLTPDGDAITAFVNGDAGAERLVLERLADSVLSGGAVNPSLQKIANAIIAKAILDDTLPGKRPGRSKSDPFKGHEVAYRFFELNDAGMSRGDALVAVGNEFGYVERQIERLVKEFRPMIGWFPEDRGRYREWRRVCEETGFEDYEATVRIDLNIRERLAAVNTAPSADQLLHDARHLLEALRVEESFDINSAPIVVGDTQAP